MFFLLGIMGAVLVGSAVVGLSGSDDLEDDAVPLEDESGESAEGTPIDPTVEEPAPAPTEPLAPTGPDAGSTQIGSAAGELIDGGPWCKFKNPKTGKDIVIKDIEKLKTLSGHFS